MQFNLLNTQYHFTLISSRTAEPSVRKRRSRLSSLTASRLARTSSCIHSFPALFRASPHTLLSFPSAHHSHIRRASLNTALLARGFDSPFEADPGEISRPPWLARTSSGRISLTPSSPARSASDRGEPSMALSDECVDSPSAHSSNLRGPGSPFKPTQVKPLAILG